MSGELSSMTHFSAVSNGVPSAAFLKTEESLQHPNTCMTSWIAVARSDKIMRGRSESAAPDNAAGTQLKNLAPHGNRQSKCVKHEPLVR